MLLRILILLCFISSATAQNTLNGTVKDKAGSFIADAHIYVLKTEDTSVVSQTLTNDSGFFSMSLPENTAHFILFPIVFTKFQKK